MTGVDDTSLMIRVASRPFMPGMNGLDATRIIKEVSSNTPVIALSAYAFEENIRAAKEAGFDDFMAKPFKVENLIEIVKRYLGEED